MTKRDWCEVSESRFDEMLCMLPPAVHLVDGFLFGEAYDHDASGHPRFMAFVRFGGRHFQSRQPMTEKDFRSFSPFQVFG